MGHGSPDVVLRLEALADCLQTLDATGCKADGRAGHGHKNQHDQRIDRCDADGKGNGGRQVLQRKVGGVHNLPMHSGACTHPRTSSSDRKSEIRDGEVESRKDHAFQ